MLDQDQHIEIGALIFDGMDQIDLTGPFEVLSRLPNARCRLFAVTSQPVRDIGGLRILPDATLEEATRLDVLHVPGGFGQEALMDNDAVLEWIRWQAGAAHRVLSVCTGALLCGAAGLLRGDGALRMAALLRGEAVARSIQLDMVYAPEPPFDSGTPETAAPDVLDRVRRKHAAIGVQRERTARRVAARLGIAIDTAPVG